MTCTRQRAFCFLACVMATLRHFLAMLDRVEATVADLRLGGVSVGTCPPRATVAGGVRPCLSASNFVFGFLLCVVYPLVFSYTVCLCTAQILLEFVLARC
jgi:hypothetical protein